LTKPTEILVRFSLFEAPQNQPRPEVQTEVEKFFIKVSLYKYYSTCFVISEVTSNLVQASASIFIVKLSASQVGKKSDFKIQVIGKLSENKNKIVIQRNIKILLCLFQNKYSIIFPYFRSISDIETNQCS
jgi:hypothetical protein